jgi:hypothetical protein
MWRTRLRPIANWRPKVTMKNHAALSHAFESVDENQAKARFDHGERNRDLYEAAGAADATACSRIDSL